MTDVLLYQSTDNGEINIANGIVGLTNTQDTMAYLCLFGGNEDDSGDQDSNLGWWGNELESDSALKYVSETQYLLRSIPATSSNLLRVEEAAKRDLAVFTDKNIADDVSVSASIPELNAVKLAINIDGVIIEFTENWGATE